MAFWLLCDDAIDPYEFLDLRHHLSLYFFLITLHPFFRAIYWLAQIIGAQSACSHFFYTCYCTFF